MRRRAGTLERRSNGWLVVDDTFHPNRKQIEFFEKADLPEVVEQNGRLVPYAKEILFHGAIRSGKTQAACKKLVEWAMTYPGTYIVSRSTLKELDDSTRKIMLDGDGVMPPALPPSLVEQRWDGERNMVKLVNGAEIRFRSLEPEQRGKIRNITPAGMLIDQIEELGRDEDEQFYVEILGRLSDPHPMAPRKMLAVANPDTDEHWVCRRWGLTDDTAAYRVQGTQHVHVSVHDNRDNLNPSYVSYLLSKEHTDPDYFSRMVLGQWGAFEGKRFKAWRRPYTVVDRMFDIPRGWEIIEGIDYGYSNPFVCLWFAIDYEGSWWCVWEHWAQEMKISDHAKAIKAVRMGMKPDGSGPLPFAADLSPSATYMDPAAWATRGEYGSPAHELMENGIWVTRGNNERLGGWARLDEMLSEVMPDGYTRLRIFPCVHHFPREIPRARIRPGTDDIEKEHDHCLDAARYAIMSRWQQPENEDAEEAAAEQPNFRTLKDWSQRKQLLRAAQRSSELWDGE